MDDHAGRGSTFKLLKPLTPKGLAIEYLKSINNTRIDLGSTL
jgi:hypothetical protein